MPNTDRMPLDDSMSLRVTRSVPVWSVLTALVVVVAQAVSLQLGQNRQAELIADLTSKIKDQNTLIAQRSVQVDQLAERMAEANLRAATTNYRVEDHERRINALERPIDVKRK